jgi:hypothetical protein
MALSRMTEAVEDGSYPLARPALHLQRCQRDEGEKPQVAEFINYYLTFVMEEVEAPLATSRLAMLR